MSKKFHVIIIGSGIIGLSIAHYLKKIYPDHKILIIDKEQEEAFHASSRNSGVLHAGFYYSANSLKAKFTVEGNRAMKAYCTQHQIPINQCGKLVVAKNEEELQQLYELEKRGKQNGSHVTIISEQRAKELEPNVRTFKKALHSPDTASVNPKEICQHLKNKLLKIGVQFSFNTKYLNCSENNLMTSKGEFQFKKIINCSGLYADKIAKDFGCGLQYTIIPFKGLYLKYTKNKIDISMNIYPVPNLKNPFLGVHFTKTVQGDIKIGPTATPAFWRENYAGLSRFNLKEFTQIGYYETKLFLTNAFNFRSMAIDEIKKYNKKHFISLAQSMVQSIDPKGFTEFTSPGIRAQLLDKVSLNLVPDFVIETTSNSIHILNAVSPAFTCAFPFAKYVVEEYM